MTNRPLHPLTRDEYQAEIRALEEQVEVGMEINESLRADLATLTQRLAAVEGERDRLKEMVELMASQNWLALAALTGHATGE